MLRECTRHDLNAVALLERDCFAPGPHLPFIAFVQYYEICRPYFVVAAEREELWGFGFGARTSADPTVAWILGVAVSSVHRRAGCGRTLVQWLIEALRGSGVRTIFATVAPANEASLSLFTRAGFRVDLLAADYMGADQDRHVLRLSLANQ